MVVMCSYVAGLNFAVYHLTCALTHAVCHSKTTPTPLWLWFLRADRDLQSCCSQVRETVVLSRLKLSVATSSLLLPVIMLTWTVWTVIGGLTNIILKGIRDTNLRYDEWQIVHVLDTSNVMETVLWRMTNIVMKQPYKHVILLLLNHVCLNQMIRVFYKKKSRQKGTFY